MSSKKNKGIVPMLKLMRTCKTNAMVLKQSTNVLKFEELSQPDL